MLNTTRAMNEENKFLVRLNRHRTINSLTNTKQLLTL
jgi:hypothetical protein